MAAHISGILNIATIFLCYSYLLGEKTIRWTFFLPYSVISFYLLVLLIQLSGLPEMNLLLLLLLFLLGKFSLSPPPLLTNITISLLVGGLLTGAKFISASLIMNLFLYSSWIPVLPSDIQLEALNVSLLFLLILLLKKPLNKAGLFLRESPWQPLFLLLGIVLNLLGILLSNPQLPFLASLSQQHIQVFLFSFFIAFTILIFVILLNNKQNTNQQLRSQQEEADRELLNYIQRLEESYDSLANFKHDYRNILLSLDEGIQESNLEMIRQIYYQTVKPTEDLIKENRQSLEKLHKILLPELRSLLRTKLLFAQTKGITVMLDVPEKIETSYLPTTTLIRLLSIILDNGIEAAAESPKKELLLSCFYLEDTLHIIIKNSVAETKLPLKALYNKGLSNKSSHQGLGLYSLKKLLLATPNITLMTNIEDEFFSQLVIIHK